MQKVYVGIDIGSIAAKIAVVDGNGTILYHAYERTLARPAEAVNKLLEKIGAMGFETESAAVTGSGAGLFGNSATIVNEFKTVTKAVSVLYPDVGVIFEMGGESSKFIRIEKGQITEYGVNGDCAAGTGSFIDQQAERLHYNVEEIGSLVCNAKGCARIAGRCSVFAKSDMIHAQQKGYAPPEVLRGLCLAVARNFKASIVKGRRVESKVAFVGGLALNNGVVSAIRETFSLSDGQLVIPKEASYIGAVGAAMTSVEVKNGKTSALKCSSAQTLKHSNTSTLSLLSTQNVRFLRDKIKPYQFPHTDKVDAYLGIDIGSVSTNLVALDGVGDLIMEIYTYTKARPIEVVAEGLKEIEAEIGDRINICGVGTTGSGRELIGELIGADVIKDEITAHKTGAIHISEMLLGEPVDTIFEIGGQDAKFIRIEKGVVTDFAMNEACAAGTGSFLEEQAERLGISIKDDFARLALSSQSPISLGERCTVFMERDVNAYQSKGAKIEDIVAGLAYSVATNYLNRVVRGRKIGDHIFFQGGTAYNDAVAAAFSQMLGKTVTIPPHNGVIGAVGAALLARDSDKQITKFRGFDLGRVNYTMREFSCGACTNNCDIQEFNVEGEKTYWGDKCSSRFRKKARTDNKPVIEDLFKKRENLLLGSANARTHERTNPSTRSRSLRAGARIGIPRTMFYFDRFPFWRAYFETLGFEVVTSDPTNKEIAHNSLELTVAEPCYPIKLAHGHVKNLVEKGVNCIFLPNVISADAQMRQCTNAPIPYLCPWHQTLPFIIKPVPAFEGVKFLSPTVQFEHGPNFVARCLKNIGGRKNATAVKAAYAAQARFSSELQRLGKKVVTQVDKAGAEAIVLIGRPYNIYDTGANLNAPLKLREYYGINVIPIDFLPLDEIDITESACNMFWDYGRKIVAAAKFVASRPNLHAIYITNFKCGPDSFVKHYTAWASDKPYLTLQFDEHANDAGTITRIEAYLDSKGLLCRSYKDERCLSPKWTTAAHASLPQPSVRAE
ncbi:MAG: hypothetical protein A3I09_00925 [Deltaproteobacteria bacterium RIFCSPLOWO2_02_FULL_47_10]|nr:MAG: hypothetical protein A3I09_00925 [Deltaproteobacteria bacterium RIFCSPLOWO2_02_FULL_47_10]